MHTTLIWWSAWGLVVGIGFFGLQEAQRHSIHWILSLPILTGAGAAAILRLKHEYKEAIAHAKWMGLSTVLLLVGMGSLYLKTEARGPFASATAHRAFLGTTFEMSLPEVERTVGRRLVASGESSMPEGLKDWIMELVPDHGSRIDKRTLSDLLVYGFPCRAHFEFVSGKLARVTLEFLPTARADTRALRESLESGLAKDYKRIDAVSSAGTGAVLFRKDAVDASLVQIPSDPLHQQLTVVLQYLPLAESGPGPLAVNSKVF
jgi:hypothetical protein